MPEVIITSSLLIIALTLLRRVWRGRISSRLQYGLWLIVALRLLVFVPVFGNSFSIMNAVYYITGEIENHVEEKQLSGELSSGEKTAAPVQSAKEAVVKVPAFSKGSAAGTVADVEEAGNLTWLQRKNHENAHVSTDMAETIPAEKLRLSIKNLAADKAEERNAGVRVLKYVWYAGMAVMVLWMLCCGMVFRRRLYRERRFLAVCGNRKVYVAGSLDSPCLYGLFRPAVYLTTESLEKERYREHALAHEMTHYRQLDHIWALVRQLCLILHWFNPLVWLAARLSVRDCESACDEGTVRILGEEQREGYGCTLIEMTNLSGKRRRAMGFAAGLSNGKKELKERIRLLASDKKKPGMTAAAAVVCGIALAACSFGGSREEAAMGRYVEEAVEFDGGGREFSALAQDGGKIRLMAAAGLDYLSSDGGATFYKAGTEEMAAGPGSLNQERTVNPAVTPGGGRIYMEYDVSYSNEEPVVTSRTVLVTEAGEEKILDVFGDNYTCFWYAEGSFYAYVFTDGEGEVPRYYKVDPVTGETEFILEQNIHAYYMAAHENLLYVMGNEGVLIYDMDAEKVTEKQDQILSSFVAGKFTMKSNIPVMIYPYGDGVYLLTRQGLYWHELYGETVDQIIDGNLCTMGNGEKVFTGMAVRETEDRPEFLVLYDGRELMRYTYDPTLPTVPDALRVYSVHRDSQVARAVNAFRAQNPDLTVIYEVGLDTAYGATVDDVLKELATEMGAGKGPDILIMDDIPYESYLEKDVLMDLSDLRESMTKEEYFVNVIDGFAEEKGLFTIPMSFAIPVLGGDSGIEGAETLADLADRLEAKREKGEDTFVFCTWDAESTLRLLAQSSQGAWMKDGALDKESVTEFLTQARRIYEIQFAVEADPYEDCPYYYSSHSGLAETGGMWTIDPQQYPLARRFDSDGAFGMIDKITVEFAEEDAPYYAGFVSGGEKDFQFFLGMRKEGETYVRMPGQRYGECLASTLLSINKATKHAEDSRRFLEYAISYEFLESGAFDGTPVNREAYLHRQQTVPELAGYGGDSFHGKSYLFQIEPPTEDEWKKITGLADSVTGVNRCDATVYEAVVEYGIPALTGETSVEEAVAAIEKNVKIYLAE